LATSQSEHDHYRDDQSASDQSLITRERPEAGGRADGDNDSNNHNSGSYGEAGSQGPHNGASYLAKEDAEQEQDLLAMQDAKPHDPSGASGNGDSTAGLPTSKQEGQEDLDTSLANADKEAAMAQKVMNYKVEGAVDRAIAKALSETGQTP